MGMKNASMTSGTQIQPHQPHDEENPEQVQKHFFSLAQAYCIKSVAAPCGFVIAWTNHHKFESPTNIFNYLETNYPTPES